MPQPVQRLARRRDPLRVGVALVQLRLLGVGAVARGDDQPHAVRARRGLHAVERARDVGPHRLALAVGERARVAGAGRLERQRVAGGRRRAPRSRSRPTGTSPPPRGQLALHLHLHAHGRPSRRRGTRRRRRQVQAVVADRLRAPRPAPARDTRRAQVARVRPPVDHRRLEQPLEVVSHRTRGRQRGEVCRALQRGPSAQARRRAQPALPRPASRRTSHPARRSAPGRVETPFVSVLDTPSSSRAKLRGQVQGFTALRSRTSRTGV